MGILEDEYKRLNGATSTPAQGGTPPRTPVLLGGSGVADPVAAPSSAPQAALLRSPPPPVDVRASLPQPGAAASGLNNILVERAGQQAVRGIADQANASSVRDSLAARPVGTLADTLYDRAMAGPRAQVSPAASSMRDSLAQRPVGALADTIYDRAMAGQRPVLPPAAAPAAGAAAPVGAPGFGAYTPPQPAPLDLTRPFEQMQSEPPRNPNVGNGRLSPEAIEYQRAQAAARAAPGGAQAPGAPPPPPPGAPPAAGAAAPQGGGLRGILGAAQQALEKIPGGATAAKYAGPLLTGVRRAATFVEPAIEAARTATVALDPRTTIADVATQASEGMGRAGAAYTGAAFGAQAGGALGAMTGLAAPVLAPVGAVAGGIAGGIAGYKGADMSIKGLRQLVGLDPASPIDRLPATSGKAKTLSDLIVPTAPAATAPGAKTGPIAEQAQQTVTPQTTSAPAAASKPVDQRYQAMLERYQALTQETRDSPVLFTYEGGNTPGLQVMYRDGSQASIPRGQALPSDVQGFIDRRDEMNRLTEGSWQAPTTSAPDAAPQAATPAAPAGRNGQGALGNVAQFGTTYGPQIQRAAQALNVSPELVAGHWGLETGWGKSIIPGTNNLGNIKDVSGKGTTAKDNATGGVAKYAQHATPDAFVDSYIDLIKRRYPGAVGAGGDAAKFGAALKAGGYAEDKNYAAKVAAAASLYGEAGAVSPIAAQAQAAPSARVVPPELSAQPVEVIRGMNQEMVMPAGDTLPKSIYDAAVATGDASALRQRAAVAQGNAYGANPAQGKLDEQVLQNRGTERVATIGAEAQRYSADKQAENVKKSVVNVPTQVGVDELGKPMFQNVPYQQDEASGQWKPVAPQELKQNTATPDQMKPYIDMLREHRDDPNYTAWFDHHFGVGMAAHYLKGKK